MFLDGARTVVIVTDGGAISRPFIVSFIVILVFMIKFTLAIVTNMFAMIVTSGDGEPHGSRD